MVAGWFLAFAYDRAEGGSGADSYTLQARFDKVDGLSVGSDVRVAGIKVGSVVNHELDTESYQAIVRFSVKSSVKLPVDTAAAITSEGLLGGNYLNLLPGGMDEMLQEDEEISETQDAIDLLGLIGEFATGGNDSGS